MSTFSSFQHCRSLGAAVLVFAILVCVPASFAQTPVPADSSTSANTSANASTTDRAVAADSAAVQSVYERMTLAYELLDVDAAAELYAEEARYILPDSEREVVEGRENIRDIFASFFKAARIRQAEITIEFRFLSREVYDNVAHDVGYYRVTGRREGDPVSTSTGKFATVLRRSDDGTWRFITDAYSPAPDSAFDALAPVPSTFTP
jgi:uncharacterized protein (TIGR02246 family)